MDWKKIIKNNHHVIDCKFCKKEDINNFQFLEELNHKYIYIICLSCYKHVLCNANTIKNSIDLNIEIHRKSKKQKEEKLKNTNTKLYSKMLTSNYQNCINLLIEKYGIPNGSYFYNNKNWNPRINIKRGREGLMIHHTKENEYIMLSNKEYARISPYDYQLPWNLVYCNLLEHLILHIKIIEETKLQPTKQNQLLGIGGIINFIIPCVNDFYAGYKPQSTYELMLYNTVINNWEVYVKILKYFLKTLLKINVSYEQWNEICFFMRTTYYGIYYTYSMSKEKKEVYWDVYKNYDLYNELNFIRTEEAITELIKWYEDHDISCHRGTKEDIIKKLKIELNLSKKLAIDKKSIIYKLKKTWQQNNK